MSEKKGHFGMHGGQYIPETLMNAVQELDAAYEHYDFASVFAFIKSSGIADFLASIGL